MPSRISKNKSTYKHIVVSQQKTKRKILAIWREKQIYHEWETIKEEAFPMIMIEARRQWINIFQVLKEVMVGSEFWTQPSDHWRGRSALEHFRERLGRCTQCTAIGRMAVKPINFFKYFYLKNIYLVDCARSLVVGF